MSDKQISNLQPALDYAARGWKIFPLFYVLKSGGCSCRKAKCQRIGKHPCTRNGVQDASNDEATVRAWWTESPYANIGLATGHGGLIVVDEDAGLDKKTGLPKVGPESWAALLEANPKEPLPNTLIAKTGGGGRHLYFLSTKEIKNSQDVIGKHLDVRGYGGYVILPPSNHESGGRYSWATAPDARIADMPQWLDKAAIKDSGIDATDDIDPKQDEIIEKGLKEDRFSADQYVKLLDYIPADCDRDTWWQIGAALKKELGEKRGWEVWNSWSQKAPDKYDAKTAEVQWNSFRPETKGTNGRSITGGTIFHYAKENGFRGFDAEAADSPDIRDNWLYAISIKRFIELNRLLEWDKEQFDANFAPHFSRGKPSEHVLKNGEFKRVDSVTYWPNNGLYVTEQGQSKLNYWRPSNVKPAPGDPSPFINHVRYLYPGEEGDIFLDYLAFQVQCPGEKVHWAVLLEGDQGNGKSYFATVMRLVLGPHNVKMVSNDQLHETFTQWQRNTQLVVVEEMMAKARLELMNKLKPIITEDWCTIREMYRPPYEQPNRFNFLFFSNHQDSLIIDNTDRRYCILKTDAKPHPESNAYYGPLFDWTRANAAVIAHCLKNRPLSNFKPKAHAPMTAGKRALIKQSMLPIEQYIYDQVEAGEYPCHWELLSPAVMVKPLNDVGIKANPKEVAKAFFKLGYKNLGDRRIGKDKVNMWAVRNFETYSEASSDQLRRIWAAQVASRPMEPEAETADAL
jgi:hypothetical protein